MTTPQTKAEAMANSIMESLPYEDRIALAMTSGDCLEASRKWHALTVTALSKLIAENERLKKMNDEYRDLWDRASYNASNLQSQLTATEAKLSESKQCRKHSPSCQMNLAPASWFTPKCTCGLNDFLSTLTAEKKEQG